MNIRPGLAYRRHLETGTCLTQGHGTLPKGYLIDSICNMNRRLTRPRCLHQSFGAHSPILRPLWTSHEGYRISRIQTGAGVLRIQR